MLAIDTSTTVRVAVATSERSDSPGIPDGPGRADGAHALARRVEGDPRRHVELLAPAVLAVLADAGVDRRALTHVVVGTGPAPFTGLRVGVATALVLAEALGVPVGGISSLDAVVATALDEARRAGQPLVGEVVAVTDAKRREVHWARYAVGPEGEVHRVDGPHVGAPSAVAPGVLVGPGAALCHAARTGDGIAGGTAPGGTSLGAGDRGAGRPALAAGGLDPAVLAVLAVERITAGEPLEPATPRYLRRPDAQPLVSAQP